MELADTKLQPFEPERYRDVSLNDLVMYAVYVLAEMKSEINTEEIVAACFLLFPERFHLRGYPSKPAQAGFRANSAGVFARCLRPARSRHGERRSHLDR